MNLTHLVSSLFYLKHEKSYCKLNYHDQKIWQTPMHDKRKHWTAVLTLSGIISSVYCDLHHWRLNQQPDCRAETLPLSYQPILHTSDTKLTSHGNCVAN